MKAYPFLISADASGDRLRPIVEREKLYDEAWLQELLRQHPNILPVAEIEPVFFPLVPIGREVVTETGVIDNLFISHRGYPVLVETKLWRNPEARREVVAQAIDYGSSLSKWTYSRLNEAAKAYIQRFEKLDLDLVDWVEQQCGPVEGERYFFEETVAKNLRLGRFLTLIVGERIRQSVIEMLNFVNRYPHLAMDVALVELQCYQWESGASWPLLVVPSIVARTEIVERSVIQVTVEQTGTYDVNVRQETIQEKPGRRTRVTLTEEAFWELLMEQAPDEYQSVRTLIDKYRDRDGISVEPRESSIVVRLDVQDSGQQLSLFFVNTNARLNIWPGTAGNQLEKAGLDAALADKFGTRMKTLMNLDPSRKELSCSIADIDCDEFISLVDVLIQSVQLAEPADR